MTGFLTVYTQNKLLAHMLNGVAFSAPTTWYIGLATAVNQSTGAVTGEPAINTNAYARVPVAVNGVTVFGAAASGSTTNSAAAITFPTANGGAWTGTLTKWFASDAATAGNILAFGDLGTSVTVAANQAPNFPTSTFTLNGSGW